MSLSDERVQEFKEIFKKEYNNEMTDAKAREAGENLVGFFGHFNGEVTDDLL